METTSANKNRRFIAVVKTAARFCLAVFMIWVGTLHFVDPDFFVKIVPAYLPWHLGLVYVSGFFEIAGGVGLLIQPLLRPAAWGCIALYIAVFPANINMAVHHDQFDAPFWALLVRLPMQGVLIAWAYWLTRPDASKAPSDEHEKMC